MRSFAIDEPNSPVRALYATLEVVAICISTTVGKEQPKIRTVVVGLLLLLLFLSLREVAPVAPRCRELGTVEHLGQGAELARTLVPGHPKVRFTFTTMTPRPVDAEAIVHPGGTYP